MKVYKGDKMRGVRDDDEQENGEQEEERKTNK